MKPNVVNVTRWLVGCEPEVHLLVIVAFLVSLAANLGVAYYTEPSHSWHKTIIAAILEFFSALLYVPVARLGAETWHEASMRKGMPRKHIVRQLLLLQSHEHQIQGAGALLLGSGCCFVAASVLLFGSSLWNGISDHFAPHLFMQPLINGVTAGSLYALMATGIGLIYLTSRFFHFAQGAMFAMAAYIAYSLITYLEVPPIVGILYGIVFVCTLGYFVESKIYRRLQRSRGSQLSLLLASIGVFLCLESILSMFFGEDTRVIWSSNVTEGFLIWGARITAVQLITVVLGCMLPIILSIVLRSTKLGRMIRAVANDRELGSIVGIPTDRIILYAFVGGIVFASIAGILGASDTGLTPTMGFRPLLMGVVAVIVGGIGSTGGALIGGLFVGLAQSFGALWLPAQWQDGIVFTILVLFLFLRPQGFFGRSAWQFKV